MDIAYNLVASSASQKDNIWMDVKTDGRDDLAPIQNALNKCKPISRYGEDLVSYQAYGLTYSTSLQCVMSNQDGDWNSICRSQSQAVTECANTT
jgi:hypothetical protein